MKERRKIKNMPLPLPEVDESFQNNSAFENDDIIILNKPPLNVTALMSNPDERPAMIPGEREIRHMRKRRY